MSYEAYERLTVYEHDLPFVSQESRSDDHITGILPRERGVCLCLCAPSVLYASPKNDRRPSQFEIETESFEFTDRDDVCMQH
jgi:hypothetical protein